MSSLSNRIITDRKVRPRINSRARITKNNSHSLTIRLILLELINNCKAFRLMMGQGKTIIIINLCNSKMLINHS